MSEFIALDRKQVLLDKWDSVGKDLSHTINLAELIVDVWEVAAVTTEERIIELLEENYPGRLAGAIALLKGEK